MLNNALNKFKRFKKIIKNQNYLYRQELIDQLLKKINFRGDAKFLDVGCGNGEATLKHAKSANIIQENVYGLDIDDDYIKLAKSKRIKVFKIDLEKERFPFDNESFELIIVDQVFEHLKNLLNLINEIDRVLAPNGYLIISTPNLAALHNRFLLLIGKQPLCINVFSDHIRGFTKNALQCFVLKSCKQIETVCFRGAGFYPFFGFLAKILAKIFPTLSVYLIFVFRKYENSSSK
jgi:SAM-dependent methyltransferase